MNKKMLGQYLLEDKLITDGQLQKALELQALQLQGANTPLLGTILVQLGALKEQDITFALAKQESDRMRV